MESLKHPYQKTAKELFQLLSTSKEGLSSIEAAERFKKYGPNELQEKKGIHPLRIFLEQFNSPLVWVLIAATGVSLAIGETVDAIVIALILTLMALMGIVQEYKAEKAIEALKKMQSVNAIVIRQGRKQEIPARELVPGDIILLETGEKIPADARLIQNIELACQEAALTGESMPVVKQLTDYTNDVSVADCKNMVYSGTIVTNGKAAAIVTGTGMNTEVGKIAHMIQKEELGMTPLQKQLAYLGKWISIVTLFITVIIFIIGITKSGDYSLQGFLDYFIVAVSLAVAAVPEGLPAVVTLSLAIGIKKMVKRNALIRKLPSVETLGSTTVICTDKTGTLTHNQMTVRKI